VHPGEILLAEFLEPLGLARSIAVPARRINEVVHGQRRISADTALRFSRSSARRSCLALPSFECFWLAGPSGD
jgi:addiction module HigA family antidote